MAGLNWSLIIIYDFKEMYQPVEDYNEYQQNWLGGKMKASLESYISFIKKIKDCGFPIQVKFGLEVCYIPETESVLSDILKQYQWDFITGAIHYIDAWGFDHKDEFWNGVDVDHAYRRYYQIMHDLINSGLFTGLAHPDSIKCFGYYPAYDLTETYLCLADDLNKAGMYAEQSGGLALNYGFKGLGLNPGMLKVFKENGVRMLTASDAHRPEHTGANIRELQEILLT
jgi:histidinol-phosphatase (PHP family)